MLRDSIINKSLEKLFLTIISSFYLISLIYKFYEVRDKPSLMILVVFMASLFVIRHYLFIRHNDKFDKIHLVIVILELILINGLYMLTSSPVSELIYMLYVADIIICYAVVYSVPIALVGYVIYFFLSVEKAGMHFDMSALVSLMTRGASFLAFVAILGYFKHVSNINVKMKHLMDELDEKNKALESFVLLKERDRIASEMHDTVGHTLTTGIVALEGAKLLFYESPEEAFAKLEKGSDQVRKSLFDMRIVVKAMKESRDNEDLINSIKLMADETMIHTGQNIVVDMMEDHGLLPLQEKIVRNAIRESITNSVKHGLGEEILITGIRDRGMYLVQVIDNGLGSLTLVDGFGLKNMKKKIESIGGSLFTESKINEGFTLTLKIPIELRQMEETDE